jgi:hypothetical protein
MPGGLRGLQLNNGDMNMNKKQDEGERDLSINRGIIRLEHDALENEIENGNVGGVSDGADGYARHCRACDYKIWMQLCKGGKWKPFDFPDSTPTGEWELHDCPRRAR